MTEPTLPLIELLQKQDDGDFLRAVAEAVLQFLMEHDVEGLIGAGRYERGGGRQTWRNGYRDRELKTRLCHVDGGAHEAWLHRPSSGDNLAPRGERLRPEFAKCAAGGQVTLGIEVVVDGGMRGKEPLHRAR